MSINCIAVDDEPAALDLISSYIEQTPYLNLIGRYNNAIAALQEVHQSPQLQLIFLDIRMADLSGIELARIISQSDKKKNLRIIFTTAYDQYAIDGFKVDALDYLVKPFNYVDFSKAAEKARDYFFMYENSLQAGSNEFKPILEQRPYIYLKVEHQLVKVDVEDILYIEGLKDYVKVFLRSTDKPLLTLTSLKRLQEKLPVDMFLRLHRSFIVATAAIKSATKTSVQVGTTTIAVSEQFKEDFNAFLNKWVL
ncbi:LytR/AlgR family response regulator transcription factor [Mucilaginibacter myungsuensis]|uniref:Response regulator transcription factor n=1 Tax=Mucilaginibacter myungsuensis TaxID=649104 RepID=A0A929PXA3_9SPHI|nr:LytTR family DNA-binding domain-containing protein [Mucilaginibacter myungsuensis]MBE9662959.1 response regulator transcription factor [Mucilaginibacter myungsuensis]MDN3598587.1 LytTR family DNA-binding domain-containing protein [Mucilaginibacter myungsuensis]